MRRAAGENAASLKLTGEEGFDLIGLDNARPRQELTLVVYRKAGQIDRVVGHADRLLTVPADPLHASNRRITILVRREKSR